jgi:hypothetical protein
MRPGPIKTMRIEERCRAVFTEIVDDALEAFRTGRGKLLDDRGFNSEVNLLQWLSRPVSREEH